MKKIEIPQHFDECPKPRYGLKPSSVGWRGVPDVPERAERERVGELIKDLKGILLRRAAEEDLRDLQTKRRKPWPPRKK